MAIEALKDAPPENVTRTQFARQRFRSSGPVNLFRRYTPFWWRRALYTPFLLALDGVDDPGLWPPNRWLRSGSQ